LQHQSEQGLQQSVLKIGQHLQEKLQQLSQEYYQTSLSNTITNIQNHYDTIYKAIDELLEDLNRKIFRKKFDREDFNDFKKVIEKEAKAISEKLPQFDAVIISMEKVAVEVREYLREFDFYVFYLKFVLEKFKNTENLPANVTEIRENILQNSTNRLQSILVSFTLCKQIEAQISNEKKRLLSQKQRYENLITGMVPAFINTAFSYLKSLENKAVDQGESSEEEYKKFINLLTANKTNN
jgi:hypothetical protein